MNKDSVMAMLEAFVHDPLINWRLLNTVEADADNALSSANSAEPHMPGECSSGSAWVCIEYLTLSGRSPGYRWRLVLLPTPCPHH